VRAFEASRVYSLMERVAAWSLRGFVVVMVVLSRLMVKSRVLNFWSVLSSGKGSRCMLLS